MRLVFDINAGDDSYEISSAIRDFVIAEIERVARTYYTFLLPAPDVYSISPLIERKYKAMLYSLAGSLLTEANWMKIFRVLAIDLNDNHFNPTMLYNDDLWSSIYPLTVGTVSSKAYDMSYSELIQKINARYAEVNGVYEGDVDIELLSFNEECNIYSEDIGRVINIDEIGSRVIVSVLHTRKLLKSIMQSDSFPSDNRIKVYCVMNDVFDEDDDDDDTIDYDEEAV